MRHSLSFLAASQSGLSMPPCGCLLPATLLNSWQQILCLLPLGVYPLPLTYCLRHCLGHLPHWFADEQAADLPQSMWSAFPLFAVLTPFENAQTPTAGANGSEPVITTLKWFWTMWTYAQRAKKLPVISEYVGLQKECIRDVYAPGLKVLSIGTYNNSTLTVSWVTFPECLQHPQRPVNHPSVINTRDYLSSPLGNGFPSVWTTAAPRLTKSKASLLFPGSSSHLLFSMVGSKGDSQQ